MAIVGHVGMNERRSKPITDGQQGDVVRHTQTATHQGIVRAHQRFIAHGKHGRGVAMRVQCAIDRGLERLVAGDPRDLGFRHLDPSLSMRLPKAAQPQGADALPLIAEHAHNTTMPAIQQVRRGIAAHILIIDGDRRVLRRIDRIVKQHDGNLTVIQHGEVLQVGGLRR